MILRSVALLSIMVSKLGEAQSKMVKKFYFKQFRLALEHIFVHTELKVIKSATSSTPV